MTQKNFKKYVRENEGSAQLAMEKQWNKVSNNNTLHYLYIIEMKWVAPPSAVLTLILPSVIVLYADWHLQYVRQYS